MNAGPLQNILRDVSQSIVPFSRVRRTDEVARVGEPQAHPQGLPAVEVVKEGDVVKAIDVTCSCGQKVRLWCVYEPE